MRRDSRSLRSLGAAALVLIAIAAASGAPVTYAAWSDSRVIHGSASAGVWAPNPPAACGPVRNYAAVVYGTVGDDVLTGGNHPQIIMGLAGNDVIQGGNSGDCLVGGPGNDRITGGNAKDILLGEDGDDHLDGGNGKDVVDGGIGNDVCDGGNGKDTITCGGPGSATVTP
jgi:Ca2+-binding RTX toxin-like protein